MENVAIEKIVPYPQNAKKHPRKQVRQIAASIESFGFNQPIVVDKKGVIIVGHGRYAAARLLGLTEVPVVYVTLTEERARAYRLADNKLNESEWDMQLVIDELKGLSSDILDLTGFDKDLILTHTDDEDVVPETPARPRTKTGDIYELGPHRIICGDSTDKETFDKLMQGRRVDMVFTDPPYEIETRGGGILKNAKSMRGIEKLGIGSFNPSLSLVTHSKTEIFCCNKPLVKTYLDLAESWDKPFDICFYKKKNTAPNYGGHLMTDTEYIIVIGEQKPRKGLPKETYSKAFIGEKDIENTTPWSKPVALCEKFIMLYSDRDQFIGDWYLGSGSTLIAAQKTGRICHGMEIDPKYVDVIVERYCVYTGTTAIKKNGTLTTWELLSKAKPPSTNEKAKAKPVDLQN